MNGSLKAVHSTQTTPSLVVGESVPTHIAESRISTNLAVLKSILNLHHLLDPSAFQVVGKILFLLKETFHLSQTSLVVGVVELFLTNDRLQKIVKIVSSCLSLAANSASTTYDVTNSTELISLIYSWSAIFKYQTKLPDRPTISLLLNLLKLWLFHSGYGELYILIGTVLRYCNPTLAIFRVFRSMVLKHLNVDLSIELCLLLASNLAQTITNFRSHNMSQILQCFKIILEIIESKLPLKLSEHRSFNGLIAIYDAIYVHTLDLDPRQRLTNKVRREPPKKTIVSLSSRIVES
jgi:hypothetical protein